MKSNSTCINSSSLEVTVRSHLLAHLGLFTVSWFSAHTCLHMAHPNLKKQLICKRKLGSRNRANRLVLGGVLQCASLKARPCIASQVEGNIIL
jgi:hypothetical protein